MPLLEWARAHDVALTDRLNAEIEHGFSASHAGEHAFDAVVGVLGMLNVLLGGQASDVPADSSVRSVEGWILGQLPG